MAHSDVFIFLNTITWVFFFFLLVYILFVVFFLPTIFKKLRIRSLMKEIRVRHTLYAVLNTVMALYIYNDCYGHFVEEFVVFIKRLVYARGSRFWSHALLGCLSYLGMVTFSFIEKKVHFFFGQSLWCVNATHFFWDITLFSSAGQLSAERNYFTLRKFRKGAPGKSRYAVQSRFREQVGAFVLSRSLSESVEKVSGASSVKGRK